ncbi:MAG: hypothetical protein WBE26_18850 [Phycisphaerae bacterium]
MAAYSSSTGHHLTYRIMNCERSFSIRRSRAAIMGTSMALRQPPEAGMTFVDDRLRYGSSAPSFRVNLSDQLAWEKRFSMLYPRWETHPYDPQKYLDDLKDLAVILEDRPQNNEAETTDDSQPVHGVEVSREKLQQMVAFAGQLASGRIGQSESR